jgi:23S rRNA (adenine2503-C2)-methyltransferase
MNSITPLLGLSSEELTRWVIEQGQPSYRAKQLHQWLYTRNIRSLNEVTVFPKSWREENETPVGRSTIALQTPTPDGTIKFLLALADGQTVETVGIPSDNRLTVCVSSQVGCAMGCTFCATGFSGFARHLEVNEIVDQVLTVQEEMGRRASHIVYMGMGEPMHNLPRVIKSLRALNQDIGIGQRQITVSTVGIPGKIRDFAHEQLQVTLAVSLHAPNQSLREQIVPTAKNYPYADLLADCREYVRTTGRRISFEYVLLSGFNDLPRHAEELATRVKGFQSHVNLIPFNPVDEARFDRPTPKQVEIFRSTLERAGVAVSVRQTRGVDQSAACGQLRRRAFLQSK